MRKKFDWYLCKDVKDSNGFSLVYYWATEKEIKDLALENEARVVFKGYASGKIRAVFVYDDDGGFQKVSRGLQFSPAQAALNDARYYRTRYYSKERKDFYIQKAFDMLHLERYGADADVILGGSKYEKKRY